MRKLIFTFIVCLTTNFCSSQTNIWGLYSLNDGAYRTLDLRPDFTYRYSSQGPSGLVPRYRETGTYRIISDTIILCLNDSTIEPVKYRFISTPPTDSNYSSLLHSGKVTRIVKSETILQENAFGRLTDYEYLYLFSFYKEQGYFENGKLSFRIEDFYKTKIITYYYSTGQIKSIEVYYNEKKTGNWYYYNENGILEYIEIYRRNKLRRTKRNAL